MRRIGKIGRINIKANKQLKELFYENEITFCEMCGTTWGLTFAHRHKRIWYRSKPELLSDANQVLLLCLECHQKLEADPKLTESMFMDLRGEENVI